MIPPAKSKWKIVSSLHINLSYKANGDIGRLMAYAHRTTRVPVGPILFRNHSFHSVSSLPVKFNRFQTVDCSRAKGWLVGGMTLQHHRWIDQVLPG